jgi:hypothetical protein
MDRSRYRSLPARLVALSFIALILLGNCWFVLALIGWRIPPWFRALSHVAVLTALAGGLWLAVIGMRKRLHRQRNVPRGTVPGEPADTLRRVGPSTSSEA